MGILIFWKDDKVETIPPSEIFAWTDSFMSLEKDFSKRYMAFSIYDIGKPTGSLKRIEK